MNENIQNVTYYVNGSRALMIVTQRKRRERKKKTLFEQEFPAFFDIFFFYFLDIIFYVLNLVFFLPLRSFCFVTVRVARFFIMIFLGSFLPLTLVSLLVFLLPLVTTITL